MNYFLAAPEGERLPWDTSKSVLLTLLTDTMALYYCEGEQPPSGATGLIPGGEKGEICWWPIYSPPPREMHGLLSQEADTPDKGKETQ